MASVLIVHTHNVDHKDRRATWREAYEALVGLYGPSLVAYDEHGWEVTAEDAPTGRVLVWNTEDESVNDDGKRAVASVYIE